MQACKSLHSPCRPLKQRHRTIHRSNRSFPFTLALLLVPLVGVARMRSSTYRLRKTALLALFALAGIGAVGCATGNGFFLQQPANYTVTVTAVSGGVQHSFDVNLNLQ
jgi:hypothetical protein